MFRSIVFIISIAGAISVSADAWALQTSPERAHANSAVSIPLAVEPISAESDDKADTARTVEEATTGSKQSEKPAELTTSALSETSAEQDKEKTPVASVEKPLRTIPAIETRSLGLPAKDASSSQVVEQKDAGLKGSWLNRLDPRKNELTRVGGALAVVLGLLVMMRGFLKRGAGVLRGGGRPSGVLEILARFPVGRGQQLILLKLARRVILVHQAGTVMTTISEVVEPNEVASLLARVESGSSKKNSNLFRAALNQCDAQYDSPSRRERRLLAARSGQPEIIDLTRSSSRSSSGLIEQRKVTA